MKQTGEHSASKRKKGKLAGPILMRREMVAFLPAVALAGHWFGLEAMTLLGFTALIVAWMTRPLRIPDEPEDTARAEMPPPPQRDEAIAQMEAMMQAASASSRSTACLVVGLDDPNTFARHMSRVELDAFILQLGERIRGVLRNSDKIARLEGMRYAVILTPTQRPDLESMIQLSSRLQAACEVPFSISARSVNATIHVGFCQMSRAPQPTGAAILKAAEMAADEAMRNGPSAIRAFSREISKQAQTTSELSDEFALALEEGQIVAFFQPQISTDTGEISGMQGVPRWLHRERGILSEADILPAVMASGKHHRFAEVMLFQCFNALREWERLPSPPGPVSLALTLALASDPKLFDRLKWELDRFDIAPSRLRLVLQQEVTARLEEDVIARNISQCAKLGCQIELAGFGMGPISVSAIRRTGAERIRIHRSFVTNVDRDPEQQRLVAAIVSFGESLGLHTLAEGVTSVGEHAMLAQLGCNHVQGKAISAPLPLDESSAWLTRHAARLDSAPRLGRRGA